MDFWDAVSRGMDRLSSKLDEYTGTRGTGGDTNFTIMDKDYCWEDLDYAGDDTLQRHVVSGECRIVDKYGQIKNRGTQQQMEEAMMRRQQQLAAMRAAGAYQTPVVSPSGVPMAPPLGSSAPVVSPSGVPMAPPLGSSAPVVSPSGVPMAPPLGSSAPVVSPSGVPMAPPFGSPAPVVSPSGVPMAPPFGSPAPVVSPSGVPMAPPLGNQRPNFYTSDPVYSGTSDPALSNLRPPQPVQARYGDIIGVVRANGSYEHYGIYVSDTCVIHYAIPASMTIGHASVHATNLRNFLRDDSEYFVLDFPKPYQPPVRLGSNQPNEGDFSDLARRLQQQYGYHLYTPEETVARAKSRLGETHYNLFTNNCEHFVIWCKTGVSESLQVSGMFQSLLNSQGFTFRRPALW